MAACPSPLLRDCKQELCITCIFTTGILRPARRGIHLPHPTPAPGPCPLPLAPCSQPRSMYPLNPTSHPSLILPSPYPFPHPASFTVSLCWCSVFHQPTRGFAHSICRSFLAPHFPPPCSSLHLFLSDARTTSIFTLAVFLAFATLFTLSSPPPLLSLLYSSHAHSPSPSSYPISPHMASPPPRSALPPSPHISSFTLAEQLTSCLVQ
ncbi:hypothetical protein E2C01_019079 [Portunus trituberculatus]|uniref:Uncharacterized protein n=1 Tax=Portunus trituberculatus TaxID=210409 RepID=A0A5B7DXA7_PORTR|nr:hypothetical protein [Portunus trituberculatus]